VDVIEGPDGAFYVSDDYAGAIWRVAYGEDAAAAPAAMPSAATTVDPLAGVDARERALLGSQGEILYEQFACATCHEPERAAPGTAVKVLEKLDERYTIETLQLLLETPPQPMPTYPMSDEQMRAVAIHLLESRR
jgi:mono/diheme cytochrome c family protein